MKQVNVHYAKTHLSKLLSEVEKGEEVFIARDGAAVAKLVPLTAAERRGWGILRGQIGDMDIARFLEPLPEDELRLWEGGDDLERDR
jgi:antitoxin (DNA-binding transcriptional repressor) of toxin-antitoxin stability system